MSYCKFCNAYIGFFNLNYYCLFCSNLRRVVLLYGHDTIDLLLHNELLGVSIKNDGKIDYEKNIINNADNNKKE